MTDGTITRRRLLGSGAAAGAGTLLTRVPGAEAKTKTPKVRTRRVDVCIVGGGFAGLTAAYRLRKKHKSVVVLEARDRVGGRVWNHDLGNGDVSERGGTFVGPTQDRVLALATEMGIGTFKTYDDGSNVYYDGTSRSTFSDSSPLGAAPPDPQALADLVTLIPQLDQMASTVPVDAPWEAANAQEWDNMTFQEWVNANAKTARFKDLANIACRPIFGAEPREMSLLFVLFYIASSGNEQNPGTFERNFNTRGGAQESRFVGGSQEIALKVAAKLGKAVVRNSPVRQIRQSETGVSVVSDRLKVKCKQVIVAVPPVLSQRIDFVPELPSARDALAQRIPQGQLWKVACVYDTPFWRADGLTGQALSLKGPCNATFDDSPEDGAPGIIFAFVGGDDARAFANASPADRKAAVVDNYVTFFGDKAANPIDYFETAWPEERWSRGGPVGVVPPGVYTQYGPALRAPIGRIHWAGTETSGYWNGYMDGAVRSGERAAAEVLEAL
jgi:monoamine oxidase